MSTATAGGSVSRSQTAAKQSRVQAMWRVMKRKPLGVGSASLIFLLVFGYKARTGSPFMG